MQPRLSPSQTEVRAEKNFSAVIIDYCYQDRQFNHALKRLNKHGKTHTTKIYVWRLLFHSNNTNSKYYFEMRVFTVFALSWLASIHIYLLAHNLRMRCWLPVYFLSAQRSEPQQAIKVSPLMYQVQRFEIKMNAHLLNLTQWSMDQVGSPFVRIFWLILWKTKCVNSKHVANESVDLSHSVKKVKASDTCCEPQVLSL